MRIKLAELRRIIREETARSRPAGRMLSEAADAASQVARLKAFHKRFYPQGDGPKPVPNLSSDELGEALRLAVRARSRHKDDRIVDSLLSIEKSRGRQFSNLAKSLKDAGKLGIEGAAEVADRLESIVEPYVSIAERVKLIADLSMDLWTLTNTIENHHRGASEEERRELAAFLDEIGMPYDFDAFERGKKSAR